MKNQLKTFITALLMLTLFQSASAQNFDEIFNQKKTQQKYLLQQVAGLQLYLSFAKKGYEIAKSGLSTIGGLKSGELSLHQFFFTALKNTRPKIKTSPQLASILFCQMRILGRGQKTMRSLESQHLLSPQELRYLKGCYQRLNADCETVLSRTLDLLTGTELQIDDAGRLESLSGLEQQMQANLAFCQHFSRANLSLSASRLQEIKEVQTSRASSGIQTP